MSYISLAVLLLCQATTATDWPIIGIVAQPSTSSHPDCGGSCQYIAASYVKYLEAAGARVVPINYHATDAELDDIFHKINGFFFPGGASEYPKSSQYIFDKTVKANDEGDVSPLWGTCMGFEWLLMGATRDSDILDPKSGSGTMDSENYSLPLDFTKAADSSHLFSAASPDLLLVMSTQNVTMNNHRYGIWIDHFDKTPALASFYNVLSTNEDRLGRTFVSTIEAKKYPIFGTQWHPEKNNFEWARSKDGTPYEAIDHSVEAVQVSQYTATFFVNQSRRSTHKYPSRDEEDNALIWNYKLSKTTGSFVQSYFFHF